MRTFGRERIGVPSLISVGLVGCAVPAVVLGLATQACLLSIDESLIPGNGDAATVIGSDAQTPKTDGSPNTTNDGSTPPNGDGGGGGNEGGSNVSACDSPRGPSTVDAGAFCIDRTEVTQSQYAAFLADTNNNVAGQSAACVWNTTFTPACNFTPQATADFPVVCVDWCDAAAFCGWAHKRLCGHIGGGPTPANDENNAASSQWFSACTNNGDAAKVYPYGATYQAAFCVGDGNAVSAVASHTSCVGGVPGLFDMSGNVNEWEDQCVGGANPSTDPCRARSGSFNSSPTGLQCKSDFTPARNETITGLGFRCCGDH